MIHCLKILLPTLVTAFVSAVEPVLAQSPFEPSTTVSPAAAAPKFLPVEEAYQLSPRIDGDVLYLDWIIAPGYYLYQHRFKAAYQDNEGNFVELKQTFPDGTLKYDDYYQRELATYYEYASVEVTLSPEARGSGSLELKVESQGCADAGLCYPPRTQYVAADLDAGFAEVIAAPSRQGPPSTSAGGGGGMFLPLVFLFAMLGGVILNLMPCVFPVLSIKVLGFTSAHLSPHGRHIHGLAYTGGVVLTFIFIASLLIWMRSTGEAIGWGFQLQSPVFVGLLVYLFFLMGLSLSGFFLLGSGLMQLGQRMTEGHSLRASFMTGVLATVVASPCTAPFMGTALGFALTQPAPVALAVFAFLGLGMALPFLLLSWWPALVRNMPKPGPWMDTFKQLMAFPLYLSCIWLLWVLGHQAGSDAVVLVLTGLMLVTLGIWLHKRASRTAKYVLAPLSIALALMLPLSVDNAKTEQLWEPYTADRLSALRSDLQPVFINLTADWCITCLANEKLALSSERFRTALKAGGIVYLKGDWTNYNPEITELLNRYQRNGVPLYLIYPRGAGEPVILPQLLTETTVLEALQAASRDIADI